MHDHRQSADEQFLVAYSMGELDEPDRLRFEQRLATEPELAAKLAAFEAIDLVGATLAADNAMPIRSMRPPARGRWSPRLLLLLAAAALLTAWLWPADDTISCEVRAVASFAGDNAPAYAADLGLPAEYGRPIGEQRGAATAPTVSVADFLSAAAAREQVRSEAALTAPAQAVIGAFFTLRFRSDSECSAMVLQLDSAGGWARRYPARSEAQVFGEVDNRFAPGVTHVLPRPVALGNSVGTVSLHPGFDVPSDLPLRRTWLLLAVRKQPIGADLLADADVIAANASAAFAGLAAMSPGDQAAAVERRLEPLSDWLRDRGFTTQRLTVSGSE